MIQITHDKGYINRMSDIGYKIVDRSGNTFVHDPGWYQIDANGKKYLMSEDEWNYGIAKVTLGVAYSATPRAKKIIDNNE